MDNYSTSCKVVDVDSMAENKAKETAENKEKEAASNKEKETTKNPQQKEPSVQPNPEATETKESQTKSAAPETKESEPSDVDTEIKENPLKKRALMIQTYLIEEEHYVSRFLKYVELEVGVQKDITLLATEVFISLILIFGRIKEQQFVSTYLTVAYPLSKSVNVLLYSKKEDNDDDSLKVLLFFWIIYITSETLVSKSVEIFVQPFSESNIL